MFIKSIHMTDYKRFHDLTIDLGEIPKRIVALVGPNGCGKSSVFDAVIFNYYRLQGRFGEYQSFDSKYHSLLQDRECNTENATVIFDKGSFHDVFLSLQKSGRSSTFSKFLSFRQSGLYYW